MDTTQKKAHENLWIENEVGRWVVDMLIRFV
jgi:hypothetical protein